jgi:hypothetical protein
MTARTGVRAAFRSREIRLLVVSACFTLLLVIGTIVSDIAQAQANDVLIGGIPAIVAAVTALLLVAHESREKRLVWDV